MLPNSRHELNGAFPTAQSSPQDLFCVENPMITAKGNCRCWILLDGVRCECLPLASESRRAASARCFTGVRQLAIEVRQSAFMHKRTYGFCVYKIPIVPTLLDGWLAGVIALRVGWKYIARRPCNVGSAVHVLGVTLRFNNISQHWAE